MKPGAYTRIFKADHDKAITAGGLAALGVYLALCRIHSDAPPDEKHSFKAGAGRIKRHCHLSVRSIKTYLPVLEREGLIAIKSGVNKDRTSDHEENKITLLGSAMAALGSANKERENCTRIKKASKEAERNSRRSAGSGAEAPAASGGIQENSTAQADQHAWNQIQ